MNVASLGQETKVAEERIGSDITAISIFTRRGGPGAAVRARRSGGGGSIQNEEPPRGTAAAGTELRSAVRQTALSSCRRIVFSHRAGGSAPPESGSWTSHRATAGSVHGPPDAAPEAALLSVFNQPETTRSPVVLSRSRSYIYFYILLNWYNCDGQCFESLEANHSHVMNKSQNQVVLPLPPPPPLEQCETGASEHLFHQNRLTGHLLLLLSNKKFMKKRCNDTFKVDGGEVNYTLCWAFP